MVDSPLAGAHRRFGERDWLVTTDTRMSFSEAFGEVLRFAERFSSDGVTPGCCVAMQLTPDAEALLSFLALIELDAHVVLTQAHTTTEECQHQLSECQVDAVLDRGELRFWTRQPWTRERWAGGVSVFSSGSSGRPRAIPHSVANLCHSAQVVAEAIGFLPEDAWLLSIPPAHVGGLSILFRTLVVGGSLVLPPGFQAGALHDTLAVTSRAFCSVVPTQLRELCHFWSERGVPSGLRGVLVGGAPMTSELLQRCRNLAVPLFGSYGMTETASAVVLGEVEQRGEHGVGIRNRLLGAEVVVRDASGAPCQADEVGQVAIRAPWLSGTTTDKDGWLLTSDLALVTAEGLFVPCGRGDRVINSGGIKIHPEQIEQLLQTIPGVRACAVVKQSDPKWGERPVAFCVLDELCRLDTLRETIEEKLPKLYRPSRLIEVQGLPTLRSGKVDYRALELISKIGA